MKIIHYTDVAPKAFASPAKGVTGRVVLGKADGAENFCMRIIELEPGGHVPLHSHPWEHEQFVHSGKGLIRQGEELVEFGPGNVVFVPGNIPHEIKNTGDEPLIIICLVPSFAPEL
jgi:quercetin dioxygenase-like cupin family protein